ncbi:apolipoprotein N-acyltransferase [Antarctobacter heliothermus]|uniref:Apolipoprotein N-acyltransferase n=1 Tax=Antarctobacter heliothermus TaxID=74033 RepID=A0A239C6C9_9RHOB|nr:apolipoprotein N-acyltransferase [Antarctobacter heliothermus]SNS15776.1 Apolipoprotein N-acyltransferase [Antarctobacter heliothermus]
MPDSRAADRLSATRGLLPGWARLPLAVAVGVIIGLGQPPYDLWYLAFPGYVAAIWLFLVSARGTPSAGTGWAVGLGYFGFSMSWIVEPFLVDAATTGWMAPFALIGLAGGLALFWGLAFWFAGRARYPALTLVLAWSAVELARAYVFTGFPWALVPYFWLPVPVIQWVSVIGPHGLTVATLAAAALLAVALWPGAARRLRTAGFGVALVAFLFGGGMMLTPGAQDLDGRPMVRLVQPNAAQHEKWDPDMIPVFMERKLRYTAMAPEPGTPSPDLVVWPETSVPNLLHRAGPVLDEITQAAGDAQVVLGVQRADQAGYYNSMLVVAPEGGVNALYDKHHLVPFGEYMPAAAVFARWNIAGLAARAEGGYSAGPGPQVVDLGALGSALPLICYEAVFPQDLNGALLRPDMLIQITNDAWFGTRAGPYQHLAQARIRAIEQGLPMLRSANTGVSAVIDGAGRVLDALPLGVAGYLDAPLPPPMRQTLYSRTGDLPAGAVLLFAGALLWARGRRNGRRESD